MVYSRIALYFCAIIICSQQCCADLVAHWAFDDGSGTVAVSAINSPADNAVLENGAIFINSIAPVAGGNISAVSLDGTNDWVETPVTGIAGANARTIAAWIKADAGSYGNAIVSWGDSWAQGYLGGRFTLKINNTLGKLRVEIGGGYIIGSKIITDSQWHHVAVTMAQGDGNIANVKLYVDGVLETLSDISSGSSINSQAAEISIAAVVVPSYPTGNSAMFFDGTIDDVRIYDHQLSAADIALLIDDDIIIEPSISNPSPASGTSIVATSQFLKWSGDNTFASYDVYAGFSAEIVFVGNCTETQLGLADVAQALSLTVIPAATTIQWQVVGLDADGEILVESPVWNFTVNEDSWVFGLGDYHSCLAIDHPDGDINGDCQVDFADLQLFAEDWMKREYEVFSVLPQETGLRAYYKFDETSGTTASDQSGNGYDASLDAYITNVWDAGGYDNGCLTISDETVLRIPASVFDGIGDQFTVSMWLSHTMNDYPDVIEDMIIEAGELDQPDGGFESICHAMSDPELNNGQWNHIAIVKDTSASFLALYINGILVSGDMQTDILLSGFTPGQTVIAMPADETLSQHSTKIDDLKIYGRALSHQELVYIVMGQNSSLIQPLNEVLGGSDFDGDGNVGFVDFAAIANDWIE